MLLLLELVDSPRHALPGHIIQWNLDPSCPTPSPALFLSSPPPPQGSVPSSGYSALLLQLFSIGLRSGGDASCGCTGISTDNHNQATILSLFWPRAKPSGCTGSGRALLSGVACASAVVYRYL